MNNPIPVNAAAVATGLILFALYLRWRNRAGTLQMVLLILFAVLVYLGLSTLGAPPAQVPEGAVRGR
ncbi:MAG TPA: hypothetical protein VEI97_15485 [bacterium]|nr:hypothetical protein [bacterium]